MTFLDSHLGEILSFLAGLLTGGIGVRIFSNNQSGRSRRQEISRNVAGGDIVAGNKNGPNE